jgi:hypothetical protein
MFMSKDNMVDICTALYTRIAEDPASRRRRTYRTSAEAAVTFMQASRRIPSWADTDEKNRVVVRGEDVPESHPSSEPVALRDESDGCPRSCRA